jgi:hypothetical protein
MTPEQREMAAANDVHIFATDAALKNLPIGSDDIEAATAAILCRALELATPDLSPQGRARLFMEEE